MTTKKTATAKPVAKTADATQTTKAKQYIVLEDFNDRNGRLFRKGDPFPFSNYKADELKIYATAENRIGRAVVEEK